MIGKTDRLARELIARAGGMESLILYPPAGAVGASPDPIRIDFDRPLSSETESLILQFVKRGHSK